MKIFKKNQVVIYVIALMLVVAGYLNYTATNDLDSAVQTSSSEEELVKMANIGDAQLVSSNVVNEENYSQEDNNTNDEIVENNEIVDNNTVSTSSSNSKSNKDYFSSSKLERDTM